MSPASHILEWAHNSAPQYRKLVGLKPGNFINETGRAAAAFNLACETVREMVKARDISHNEYSADNVLEAARLMLGWSAD